MRYLKLRLIIAVAAFAIWTAWLANQAYWTADPIVVSRPQILAASIVVEAAVEGPGAEQVVITAVHKNQTAIKLDVDQKLLVGNLGGTRGFDKAGSYLLALEPAIKEGRETFEVIRIPDSPGFPPYAETAEQKKKRDELLKPPIYPANKSTLMQLDSILPSPK